MRWLALDVGARRVGVAICDADEQVATPLPAFPFASPEQVAETTARLLQEWEAGGVVVGLPVSRRGQGRGEQRVGRVVDALLARVAVAVEVVDERGTTVAAERLLAEAGVPRRHWQERVDSLAAQIILQSHLAARQRSSLARDR